MNFNSIITYLLYLYILTLPLMSEKILSGKLGDLVLFIIFLTYLIGVIFYKDIKNRLITGLKLIFSDILSISIILLLIIMCASIFYSFDKKIAITETLRFLSYVILFFIIKFEIISEEAKVNMLKIYIVITALLSVMGIIQYITKIGLSDKFINGYKFGDTRKIAVTLSNPNNYGAYLVLAIFPVLIIALKEKNNIKKLIYFILFTLIIVNIFFTYSRNAWLGFAIGCIVLIFIYSYKLVLVFGGVGILGLFVPQIFKRISEIFDFSQNIARINLWKLAFYMIKDKPIFGIGNGNYVSLYNKYATMHPELRYGNINSYPCHNSYIKIETELGIFGSISFFSILIGAVLKVKQMVKVTNNNFSCTFFTGFLASMAAFYFMNISDNLFFVPKTTTYFWVLLAISQSFLYNNIKINKTYNVE